MTKIKTKDCISLNHKSEEIFNIISDLSSYQKWWPKQIKVKLLKVIPELIGSCLKISPFGGMSFNTEIVSFKIPEELNLKYSGIYSGTGKWTIEKLQDKTRLCYEVDLVIENKVVVLISKIVNVEEIHSKLIRKLLENLDKQLNNIK